MTLSPRQTDYSDSIYQLTQSGQRHTNSLLSGDTQSTPDWLLWLDLSVDTVRPTPHQLAPFRWHSGQRQTDYSDSILSADTVRPTPHPPALCTQANARLILWFDPVLWLDSVRWHSQANATPTRPFQLTRWANRRVYPLGQESIWPGLVFSILPQKSFSFFFLFSSSFLSLFLSKWSTMRNFK